MPNEISFKLGGPAGSGIMTVGISLSTLLKRSGLNIYSCKDYPSLIKGGNNLFMIRASDEKLYSNTLKVDVVVAIDQLTVDLCGDDIRKSKILIYDSEAVKRLPQNTGLAVMLPVSFEAIAVALGNKLFTNTVAFGAVCGAIKADMDVAKKILTDTFSRKGPDIVKANIDALQKGYDATFKAAQKAGLSVKKLPDKDRILIDGNKAMAIGSIKAGLKFMASYPMTPATSVMENVAAAETDYNIVLKHTEDEIAAINMAIGAAFAGARSMVATSGGGFALMTEAVGMAGIAEVPIVIIESQRGGPSTGLPTYTGQEDLRFVQHASQGEFPRVIIAPGDVEEAFYDAFTAHNLAEIYQTPIFLITDKELASMEQTVPKFNTSGMKINRGNLLSAEQMKSKTNFKRHELVPDGLSNRCIPGSPNGMHVASSYEHDETGYTSEDSRMHVMQTDKRFRKLDYMYDFYKGVNVYGDSNPDIQVVVWGTTKGAALESLKMFKELGIKVKVIQVHYICPFPVKHFTDVFDTKKPSIVVEHNKTGQLRGIIRESTGIFIENLFGKYDARPIYPEHIVEQVKKVLKR